MGVRQRALAALDLAENHFDVLRSHQPVVARAGMVRRRIRLHVGLSDQVLDGGIQLCRAMPPSTTMEAPVTYPPNRSESTATAMAATSAGLPKRPSGMVFSMPGRPLKPSPGMAPGTIALTRMPCGPSARASSFTSMVCPALEAL